MDLTEFPSEEKPLDNDNLTDEIKTNAGVEPESDTSASPDEDEEQPKEDAQSERKTRGDFGSEQELFEAYKLAEKRAVEKAAEAADYKRMLDQLGHDTRRLLQQADEEAFIKEMRDSYAKDPVAAIAKMVGKAQQETLGAIDTRIGRSVRLPARIRTFNGRISRSSV